MSIRVQARGRRSWSLCLPDKVRRHIWETIPDWVRKVRLIFRVSSTDRRGRDRRVRGRNHVLRMYLCIPVCVRG